MKHQLNIIIGSTRPGRAGPVFANWLEGFAREHGKFEPVLTDIAAFNLPVLDEPHHPRLGKYENDHTKAWSKAIDAADAFVFVAPEYNYFAAPAIVNAVDYLLKEWRYKPAAILSYGGVSGGLRAAQAVKPLLTSVGVMPIPEGVALPLYQKLLDEDGAFQPNEQVLGGARTMLDELLRWSEALKADAGRVRPGACPKQTLVRAMKDAAPGLWRGAPRAPDRRAGNACKPWKNRLLRLYLGHQSGAIRSHILALDKRHQSDRFS